MHFFRKEIQQNVKQNSNNSAISQRECHSINRIFTSETLYILNYCSQLKIFPPLIRCCRFIHHAVQPLKGKLISSQTTRIAQSVISRSESHGSSPFLSSIYSLPVCGCLLKDSLTLSPLSGLHEWVKHSRSPLSAILVISRLPGVDKALIYW